MAYVLWAGLELTILLSLIPGTTVQKEVTRLQVVF